MGSNVACKRGAKMHRYVVTQKAEGKLLLLGFAGRIQVMPEKSCRALPLRPKLKEGQQIWVPALGNFERGTVTKLEPEIGRVWVRYDFGGKKLEDAFSLIDVAAELEDVGQGAAVEPGSSQSKGEGASKSEGKGAGEKASASKGAAEGER